MANIRQPLKRGQPPKRGQRPQSQSVLCSEVLLVVLHGQTQPGRVWPRETNTELPYWVSSTACARFLTLHRVNWKSWLK